MTRLFLRLSSVFCFLPSKVSVCAWYGSEQTATSTIRRTIEKSTIDLNTETTDQPQNSIYRGDRLQTMSSQNGSNGATNNNGDIQLECGTSLAEMEYTTESHAQERRSEEKKEEHEHQSRTNPVPSSDRIGSNEEKTFSQAIHDIRSSLANDVVKPNGVEGAYSTFTSPFETPEAHKSSGQTAIRESERYVSVPMVYCDQTASNRPLLSVEKYIQNTCLPLYGNTHTNTSITGSQSTAFVAEARQVVAEGVNAKITGKAAMDVVLFA